MGQGATGSVPASDKADLSALSCECQPSGVCGCGAALTQQWWMLIMMIMLTCLADEWQRAVTLVLVQTLLISGPF